MGDGSLLKAFIDNQRRSKTQIANDLAMSRTNLYQYFSTESISPENKKMFEDYFGTSIFTGDVHEQPAPQPFIEQRRQIKQTDNPGVFFAPFMPITAQAGYTRAIDQAIYLDNMEKFALPPGINPRGASWMYFEIQGDSMEDTFKEKDVILCSMVHKYDWDNIRNFYVYTIVTESNIITKRVFAKSPQQWVLISDNEEIYPQQLIDVSEIKELWLYRRTIHTDAAPPKRFEITV